MRQAPFLNIVTFPISLEFHHSALGLRRRITIGRLRGTLILPLPNLGAIDIPFAGLLPPRVRNIDLAMRVYAQTHGDDLDSMPYWGKYFTWHKDNPAETAMASVHLAVLAFAPAQPHGMMTVDEVAKECLEQFPEWCSRLVDWIEVLTGDDLNAAHPLRAASAHEGWTSAAWIYSAGGTPEYKFVNPVLRLFGSRGEHAMTTREWGAAIRAANLKRNLPEIWALLRDARAAHRRGNGRRAVLDAATAAELIIDRQLNLLRTNGVDFVEKLLKSSWQVSRRIELMTALGMWLPAEMDKKLPVVRNRVVHSNAPVSKAESAAAVDVAEQLARHYELNLLTLKVGKRKRG